MITRKHYTGGRSEAVARHVAARDHGDPPNGGPSGLPPLKSHLGGGVSRVTEHPGTVTRVSCPARPRPAPPPAGSAAPTEFHHHQHRHQQQQQQQHQPGVSAAAAGAKRQHPPSQPNGLRAVLLHGSTPARTRRDGGAGGGGGGGAGTGAATEALPGHAGTPRRRADASAKPPSAESKSTSVRARSGDGGDRGGGGGGGEADAGKARHARAALPGAGAANNADSAGAGATAPSPLTPEQALKRYGGKLSAYERQEILSYNEVYFVSGESRRRATANAAAAGAVGGSGAGAAAANGVGNGGFDDERGSYIHVPHDHVAYRYEVIKVIGKGSFGQVVKSLDHKTRRYVALKMVRNEKRFHRQAEEEVRILEHLRSQDRDDAMNVVHLLEHFVFRGHVCMTFELLGANLYELIKRGGFRGFEPPLVRRLAHGMLQCLDGLHRNRIIHCDLKPENVLLRHSSTSPAGGAGAAAAGAAAAGHRGAAIKVIDFGSSCFEHQRVYTYIQSRFYRAPEVIMGARYGPPIDVWSLGCIVAELVTGRPLFAGEDEGDQLACIMEVLGTPAPALLERCKRARSFVDSRGRPRYCTAARRADGSVALGGGRSRRGRARGPPGSRALADALGGRADARLVDFLRRCVEWDPDARPTPRQALGHPWLRRRLPKTPDGAAERPAGTAAAAAAASSSSSSPGRPPARTAAEAAPAPAGKAKAALGRSGDGAAGAGARTALLRKVSG
ncbi:dual specificity tyrosine-phosphorylation-regulated kinase 2-like [Petromyzon marinus]|uniref:dual specificity tyrosine-phosphorylation-regulated kinase 2-like n=1 Tax=Petromyzon marinus TaxID=7757 RepID=UPI003F725D34